MVEILERNREVSTSARTSQMENTLLWLPEGVTKFLYSNHTQLNGNENTKYMHSSHINIQTFVLDIAQLQFLHLPRWKRPHI